MPVCARLTYKFTRHRFGRIGRPSRTVLECNQFPHGRRDSAGCPATGPGIVNGPGLEQVASAGTALWDRDGMAAAEPMYWKLQSRIPEWTSYERVIVFDGICRWCNAWVTFLLARDREGTFKFSPLQSDAAQRLLRELRLPTTEFETFLYVEGQHVYGGSTAALRIVRQLPGLWPIFYILVVIPRPIRDALYRLIARSRYAWMGKAEHCRVPTPSERARFV